MPLRSAFRIRAPHAIARLLVCASAAAPIWASIVLPGYAVKFRPPPGPGGGQIEPVAVFGADDRTRLPEQYRGLQNSVGVLYDIRSRTMCTAFCVADNIVASAAHCIYRAAGAASYNTDGFVFRRPGSGNRATTPIAGAGHRSSAQNMIAGTATLSVKPPIDAARDWALIKLGQPVCQGQALPIRTMTSEEIIRQATAKRMFQVGYHRDFMASHLVYSQPCEAGRNFGHSDWKTVSRDFTDPDHLILHTCDTGVASSGSPLLVDAPDGPEVVAINVGTYMQARVMIEDGRVVHRYKADAVANTAVGVGAFADKLAVFRQADILKSGAPIRTLQAELKSRGFYRGQFDGLFGPLLRKAIEDYERERGLPETGLPTGALVKRLEAESLARRGGSRV